MRHFPLTHDYRAFYVTVILLSNVWINSLAITFNTIIITVTYLLSVTSMNYSQAALLDRIIEEVSGKTALKKRIELLENHDCTLSAEDGCETCVAITDLKSQL